MSDWTSIEALAPFFADVRRWPSLERLLGRDKRGERLNGFPGLARRVQERDRSREKSLMDRTAHLHRLWSRRIASHHNFFHRAQRHVHRDEQLWITKRRPFDGVCDPFQCATRQLLEML